MMGGPEARLSSGLLEDLAAIVGTENVLTGPGQLRVYEADGFTLQRMTPRAVVLPASTAEVAGVVGLLAGEGVPFVPRGAGTGLSGGTLPLDHAVMIALTRMNRMLELDLKNRQAVVEAGLVNLRLTRAVEKDGLHYAPDPSSQAACTIGGNVAENSGGPHTLKYGVTVNHVLGLTVVLADGRVVELGGAARGWPGYDLTGLFVGSEGTLGLATEVRVRLTPNPEAVRTFLAVFDAVEAATEAVSAIIASGVIPAALEMMDQPVIEAVEAKYGFGFPLDAAAVLIVELDGPGAGIDAEARQVASICRDRGAREVREARTESERQQLWQSRKKAFGAIGRLSPSYVTQDGVVPRTRLPEILKTVAEVGARHRLRVANVFHAGDGNIHPLLLYDERKPEEVERVLAASREILVACVALGGSISGEHGIGVEKLELVPEVFSEADLAVMERVRRVFNPAGLCNAGKLYPTTKSCIEVKRPRPPAPL